MQTSTTAAGLTGAQAVMETPAGTGTGIMTGIGAGAGTVPAHDALTAALRTIAGAAAAPGGIGWALHGYQILVGTSVWGYFVTP